MKNEKKNFVARIGFTLVEMLIVVAIICILAGILLATFGGATDSARAAQCLSNMRALAMAANAYAMQYEWYPLAGSREVMEIGTDKTYYLSQPGWVSWLCEGNYDDGNGHARSTAHKSNQLCPFYGTGNEDDMTFAITNGAIWASCAKNRAIYTCPVHALYRKKHGRPATYWSYVMNARFGWDYTKGSSSFGTSAHPGVIRYGTLQRADKMLLFAELPTVNPSTGEDLGDDASGLTADSVLQYLSIQASGSNDKGAYSSNSGDAESIGFVHKAGKGNRCAHVAFADGHTEKLVWRDGGVDPKTLTAYLCRGWDVTMTAGSGWKLAQGADKTGE